MFLEKNFFSFKFEFDLVFLLVCLKQPMAVGEGSVNHPKNLRSRDVDDLGHVIDVDFIGKILVFDDISNVKKKM